MCLVPVEVGREHWKTKLSKGVKEMVHQDECSSTGLRSWLEKKDKGSGSPLGVHTHSGPGEQMEG